MSESHPQYLPYTLHHASRQRVPMKRRQRARWLWWLLVGSCWAAPSYGTIAWVPASSMSVHNETAGTNEITMTVPFGGMQMGNRIICSVTGTADNDVSCRDLRPGGNTFFTDKIANTTGNFMRETTCSAYLASGLNAGDVITIHFDSTLQFKSAVCNEYSGIVPAPSLVSNTALDVTAPIPPATGTGSSATPSSNVSPNTAQVDELWIGSLGFKGTTCSATAGSGYTQSGLVCTASGSPRRNTFQEFQVKYATGTGAATATIANVDWAMNAAKYLGIGDRYWVGGTGAWSDSANHWALTSGGSPAAGLIPGTSTRVHVDANSGSGTINLDDTGVREVLSLDFTGSTITAMTWTNTSGLNVFGDVTLNPSVTFSGPYEAIDFEGAAGGTVTSNGAVFPDLRINGSGTWTLADAFVSLSGPVYGGVQLAGGTLVTAGFPLTTGQLLRTSGSPTLTLNASTVLLNVASSLFQATGMTVNAGTSILEYAAAATNGNFIGDAKTYSTLKVDNGATVTVSDTGNTFSNILLVGGATLKSIAGGTQTTAAITGPTCFAASGLPKLWSSAGGSQSTWAKTGGGLIATACIDVKDQIFPASSTCTCCTNSGNNTNITFNSCDVSPTPTATPSTTPTPTKTLTPAPTLAPGQCCSTGPSSCGDQAGSPCTGTIINGANCAAIAATPTKTPTGASPTPTQTRTPSLTPTFANIPVDADSYTVEYYNLIRDDLLDPTSGVILAQQGETVPRFPSSIIKVLTLLVTSRYVDQHPEWLDNEVQVTGDSIGPSGDFCFHDSAELTLYNLLHCMILKSGNDAALGTATYVATQNCPTPGVPCPGSVSANCGACGGVPSVIKFVGGGSPVAGVDFDSINMWDYGRVTLGMLDTKPYTPQGFEHSTVTTTRDLQKLLAAAYNDPLAHKIMARAGWQMELSSPIGSDVRIVQVDNRIAETFGQFFLTGYGHVPLADGVADSGKNGAQGTALRRGLLVVCHDKVVILTALAVGGAFTAPAYFDTACSVIP